MCFPIICVSLSSLQSIIIPGSVEIRCSKCFSSYNSLSSISIESKSQLIQIARCAFLLSSLQSDALPRNVETFRSKCLQDHQSLSSISSESNSRLTRLESSAFSSSSLQSIVIPRPVGRSPRWMVEHMRAGSKIAKTIPRIKRPSRVIFPLLS
jgi:hypothetical protein